MSAPRPAGTPRVLALGVAQTLAWGSSYYLPAILAPSMATGVGTDSSTVFAMFSGALLASALLGPRVGRWIDAHGGRGMLASSNLVFAIGLVLMGLARSPLWLGIGWVVMGIAMAMGLYDAAFATLARWFGDDARRPITWVALIAGFASTVAWPLSSWLESEFGWRTTCLVWAAVHLAVCLPINLLMPRGGAHVGTVPVANEGAAPPRLRHERVLLLLLAYVFAANWFVSTAMAAHLPALLQLAGATPTAAIAASALVGPAQVVARLFEYGVLRNVDPIRSTQAALLLHPISSLSLLWGAPGWLFAVLHGAGNGILTIAAGTLSLTVFGAVGYGARQGLLAVPARVLQAIAPISFGLVVTTSGTTALGVTSALLACGFIATMAVAKMTRSTRLSAS